MNSTYFLSSFLQIRDKWFPNLKVNIESCEDIQIESRDFRITANFAINCDKSSNVSGGRSTCNCESRSEVNHKTERFSAHVISGESEELNNKLQKIIYRCTPAKIIGSSKISIGEYHNNCLISCSTCNGRGHVSCRLCSGSGTLEESYQAHVSDHVYRDQDGREIRNPIYATRYRHVN